MKTAWKVALLIVVVLIASWLYFGRNPGSGTNPNFIEPGQTGKPMVLDLGSTGCIPCQMMAPVLKELAAEYKDKLDVQIIDVYEQNDLAQRYRVYAIPIQIFFDKNGKEIYRHEGFIAKEDIIKQLKDLGLLYE